MLDGLCQICITFVICLCMLMYAYVTILLSLSQMPKRRGQVAEVAVHLWSSPRRCESFALLGPWVALSLCQEGLFSFEFPEKPGALMRFLEQLPPGEGYEGYG